MRHPPDPRPMWRAIVAAGGIMPVSDTERARHRRVQAALRAVFGLPDDTAEEQLIDARKPDRRGIAELATLYLREYAARLDPTADLDEVDRAALAWRTDSTAQDIAEALAALSRLGEPAARQAPTAEQLSLFTGPWADLLDSLT